MTIAVAILLGLAAAWTLCAHIVLICDNRRRVLAGVTPSHGSAITTGATIIAFILALGFLGLLLK